MWKLGLWRRCCGWGLTKESGNGYGWNSRDGWRTWRSYQRSLCIVVEIEDEDGIEVVDKRGLVYVCIERTCDFEDWWWWIEELDLVLFRIILGKLWSFICCDWEEEELDSGEGGVWWYWYGYAGGDEFSWYCWTSGGAEVLLDAAADVYDMKNWWWFCMW